jgi:mRNA deadenylase 3'-5' endonuclease subunit Ccr4
MKENIEVRDMEKLVGANKVSYPFNIRKWVPNIDIDSKSNNYIRIMSYNILCNSLVGVSTNLKEHQLEKMSFIKWEERRKKIISEITVINPDVLCLQELEKDDYLISELAKLNFDVIIVK